MNIDSNLNSMIVNHKNNSILLKNGIVDWDENILRSGD